MQCPICGSAYYPPEYYPPGTNNETATLIELRCPNDCREGHKFQQRSLYQERKIVRVKSNIGQQTLNRYRHEHNGKFFKKFTCKYCGKYNEGWFPAAQKMCGEKCAIEWNRRINREKYRRKNGLIKEA